MFHGAPWPIGEQQRLEALRRYEILDSPPESAFDDLVRLAAQICCAPAASISLVDSDRIWFKSRLGIPVTQVPRRLALASYAILDPTTVMVVPDMLADSRFREHPLVTGPPRLRFHAAVPLRSPNGEALGTLSVCDDAPRQLSQGQREALQTLAHEVTGQLDLRLASRDQDRRQYELASQRGERHPSGRVSQPTWTCGPRRPH
jgi:GAF domain-containing protein